MTHKKAGGECDLSDRQDERGWMRRLQEFYFARKAPFSERFTALLPGFLTLLETEWSESNPLKNVEEQAFVRQAHRALGRLNELQDGAP